METSILNSWEQKQEHIRATARTVDERGTGRQNTTD